MERPEERKTLICPHFKEPCTNGVCPSFEKWQNKDTLEIPHCRFWIMVDGYNEKGDPCPRWECSNPFNTYMQWQNAIAVEQNSREVNVLREIIFAALPGSVKERIKEESPNLFLAFQKPQIESKEDKPS